MFRTAFLCVFLFYAVGLKSQFTDSFTDGELLTNPTWLGNVDSFTVNTSGQLQLQAPANRSSSFLSTAQPIAGQVEWQIWFSMDFNPSGSNYTELWLTADSLAVTNQAKGYFIQLGSRDDDVKLYRSDGSSKTLLIDGADDLLDQSIAKGRLSIEKTNAGHWTVAIDTSGGFAFDSVGTAFDNTYRTSAYFAIACHYTATRSDRFFFDDISVTGSAWQDLNPPRITRAKALAEGIIQLEVNESIDSTNATFLWLEQNKQPVEITGTDSTLRLVFDDDFPEEDSLSLLVSGLRDTAGNTMADTTLHFYIPRQNAYGDVLITEIMADDFPSQGLPFGEYVEIYNRSEVNISLNAWRFFDERDSARIGDFVIPSNGYFILCHPDDSARFSAFGPTLGLANWPTLNNGGERIGLTDATGRLIHAVSYSRGWYRNLYDDEGRPLDEGGVSLEMINTESSCGGFYNWYPSQTDIGGTPGLPNAAVSISLNQAPTVVKTINMMDLQTTAVLFNAPIGLCPEADSFIVVTDETMPRALESYVNPQNPEELLIRWEQPVTDRNVHHLRVEAICNCSNEPIPWPNETPFGVPVSILPGDIRINEVLFNPESGGVDFIELVNASNQVKDIRDLKLFRLSTESTDSLLGSSTLHYRTYQMAPGRHLALTASEETLLEYYSNTPPEHVLEVYDLLSLPNDESQLVLGKVVNNPIDAMQYSEDMHYPLLDETRGVSLERISVLDDGLNPNNWQSAAHTVGYASPGQQNSQGEVLDTSSTETIRITPSVFTPNGDGQTDFCQIQYRLGQEGRAARVRILDRRGYPIRHLVDNEWAGQRGFWVWDGTMDNGQRAPAGPYVVNVRLTHPSHKTEVVNRTVVSGWDP